MKMGTRYLWLWDGDRFLKSREKQEALKELCGNKSTENSSDKKNLQDPIRNILNLLLIKDTLKHMFFFWASDLVS